MRLWKFEQTEFTEMIWDWFAWVTAKQYIFCAQLPKTQSNLYWIRGICSKFIGICSKFLKWVRREKPCYIGKTALSLREARSNFYNAHLPQSSTTNSKMVSKLSSSMSGKGSLPCLTRNSSILARSSSSRRAPTPHMRANTNRRLKWVALRMPCSSLLGIRPWRRSRHWSWREDGKRILE